MDQAIAQRETPSGVRSTRFSHPRIGIIVVAYHAPSALAHILDRVPKACRPRITHVFVRDDTNVDSTCLVGLDHKHITHDLPLTIVRDPGNFGYGGNQKAGYRLAIEHDLDIVVLLHGDGRYAPERLEDIVAPIERGECDAVFGSRMMVKRAARDGGMPLHKYLGNKLLTGFENRMLGTNLTEFHSGYRAYSVDALASIPFERNSDDYAFDTQIIIQLVDAGKRVTEVPIPSYSGDEIGYLNGLKYAKDVSLDVSRYRLSKLGFTSGELGRVGPEYALKQEEASSHTIIMRWLDRLEPARILDLGCSSGLLSERARGLGHELTGVDLLQFAEVEDRVDHFIQANLDQGLPQAAAQEGPYDIVLAADVLEHVREPEKLLEQIHDVLAPPGILIASVPNFGHWYARGRTAFGLFDYDQRGVLDQGHVRFFTRRGLLRRLRNAGFTVTRMEATGLPLDVLAPGEGSIKRVVRALDRFAVTVRPTMFGYQFVCQCEASTRHTK